MTDVMTKAADTKALAPTPSQGVGGIAKHVVGKGESLSEIAHREHVTLRDLQTVNPAFLPTPFKDRPSTEVRHPNLIHTGESIALPPDSYSAMAFPHSASAYVHKGDSLSAIAAKNGPSVDMLRQLNPKLGKSGPLHPGQTVVVRDTSPMAPTPQPPVLRTTALSPLPDTPGGVGTLTANAIQADQQHRQHPAWHRPSSSSDPTHVMGKDGAVHLHPAGWAPQPDTPTSGFPIKHNAKYIADHATFPLKPPSSRLDLPPRDPLPEWVSHSHRAFDLQQKYITAKLDTYDDSIARMTKAVVVKTATSTGSPALTHATDMVLTTGVVAVKTALFTSATALLRTADLGVDIAAETISPLVKPRLFYDYLDKNLAAAEDFSRNAKALEQTLKETSHGKASLAMQRQVYVKVGADLAALAVGAIGTAATLAGKPAVAKALLPMTALLKEGGNAGFGVHAHFVIDGGYKNDPSFRLSALGLRPNIDSILDISVAANTQLKAMTGSCTKTGISGGIRLVTTWPDKPGSIPGAGQIAGTLKQFGAGTTTYTDLRLHSNGTCVSSMTEVEKKTSASLGKGNPTERIPGLKDKEAGWNAGLYVWFPNSPTFSWKIPLFDTPER